METFFTLLAICAGNSPVPGEFPAQRPVTRSFDVFFDLCLNNGWVNNREAGDLRRHLAYYDVIVMQHNEILSSVISIFGSTDRDIFNKKNLRDVANILPPLFAMVSPILMRWFSIPSSHRMHSHPYSIFRRRHFPVHFLMKMYEFRLKFHWSLFLIVQLTISQHWLRWLLGADQATSHYLNQWWLVYWRIYASLGLNELMFNSKELETHGCVLSTVATDALAL